MLNVKMMPFGSMICITYGTLKIMLAHCAKEAMKGVGVS